VYTIFIELKKEEKGKKKREKNNGKHSRSDSIVCSFFLSFLFIKKKLMMVLPGYDWQHPKTLC
jgi:hypothetical protein